MEIMGSMHLDIIYITTSSKDYTRYSCKSALIVTYRHRFDGPKGGAIGTSMTSGWMQCFSNALALLVRLRLLLILPNTRPWPVTQVGWVERACMNLACRLKASAVRRGVNGTISRHRGPKVS